MLTIFNIYIFKFQKTIYIGFLGGFPYLKSAQLIIAWTFCRIYANSCAKPCGSQVVFLLVFFPFFAAVLAQPTLALVTGMRIQERVFRGQAGLTPRMRNKFAKIIKKCMLKYLCFLPSWPL